MIKQYAIKKVPRSNQNNWIRFVCGLSSSDEIHVLRIDIDRKPGTVATSGVSNLIGKGSVAKERNVFDVAAAGADTDAICIVTMLALRFGVISNETTSFSIGPMHIRAQVSTRDTQPQREFSKNSNTVAIESSFSPNKTLPMPTRRRLRPLPVDMVVDIDVCESDNNDTAFVTPGALLQTCKDSAVYVGIYSGFFSRAVRQ